MASFSDFVFPGAKLSANESVECGFGTFRNKKKEVIASICGLKRETAQRVAIAHWARADAIARVGDVVIAQITEISQRMARASMICLNERALLHSCAGIIRQQNVRELDTDSVQIWKCFRPSDIVKAEIVSLGNQNDYYLSTAAPHFGVIAATSTLGHAMKAIAWNKMQCITTKVVEARKVAKTNDSELQ